MISKSRSTVLSRRKPVTSTKSKNRLAMVFIWVPVGVMGILLLGPIIFNAVVSLYHWVLLGNAPTFAGIGEYQQLVADPQYVQSLLRTVLFVVITVGVEMIVGFFVAYLLYRHFNRLTILQMLFLLQIGRAHV